MAGQNRKKYFEKKTKLGSKKITLYSLDGQVWSTRKDELENILQRHQNERACYSEQISGGPQAKVPTVRPKITAVTPQGAKKSKLLDTKPAEAKSIKAKPAATKPGKAKPEKAEKKSPKKAATKKTTTKKTAAKKTAAKKPQKKAAIKVSPKKRASSKAVAKKKTKAKSKKSAA